VTTRTQTFLGSVVIGASIPVSAAVIPSAIATGVVIRARLFTFWLLSPAELGESAGDSKELGRLSAAADATVAEVTVAAAAAGSFTPTHNVSTCGRLVMAAGAESRNRLLSPWLFSPAELEESAGALLVVGGARAAAEASGGRAGFNTCWVSGAMPRARFTSWV
jgi:hypothetical protein